MRIYLFGILASALFFSCSQTPAAKSDSVTTTNQVQINVTNTTTVTNLITDNNLKLKLKNYMGAASVGDLVSYGLDYSNSQLFFSNISLQYTWSASYHQLANGMNGFYVPVINEPAYFLEIPDQVLAAAFRLYNNNESQPAIAIMTPNSINNADDLTNITGTYFQMMANRQDSSDFTKGLYRLEVGVTRLVSNGWKYYSGTNSSVLQQTMSGQISYTNGFALSTWSNQGGSGSTTFTANGLTYVADMGINKGFSFGLSLRTTPFTTAQAAGKYLGMYMVQSRNNGHLALDENEVMPFYVIFSNTDATNLDIYSSTNGDVPAYYSKSPASAILANITGSDDGQLSAAYYLIGNVSNAGSFNIVMVPSPDLNTFCLAEWTGSAQDTNNFYYCGFGFFKRIQ